MSACIEPQCYKGYGVESGNEGFNEPRIVMGENLVFMGASSGTHQRSGMGIYINPDTADHDFAYTIWRDLNFLDLNTSLYILVDTGGTYVNYNTFENINGQDCSFFIHFEETTAHEISANIFNNVKYEAGSFGDEHYPIYLEGKCCWNIFDNCMFMDWTGSGDYTDYIKIDSGDADNNYFSGSSMHDSYIYNAGDWNSFYGTSYTGLFNLNSTHIMKNKKGDVGVKFYDTCANGANPYTYFYGDDSGTDKFGYLQVASNGEFRIASDTGEVLALTPSQGDNAQYVRIDDVLKLDGRTMHPSTPVEGMIMYNTTLNKLQFYTGAAWETVTSA